jgi:hypothetical protein
MMGESLSWNELQHLFSSLAEINCFSAARCKIFARRTRLLPSQTILDFRPYSICKIQDFSRTILFLLDSRPSWFVQEFLPYCRRSSLRPETFAAPRFNSFASFKMQAFGLRGSSSVRSSAVQDCCPREPQEFCHPLLHSRPSTPGGFFHFFASFKTRDFGRTILRSFIPVQDTRLLPSCWIQARCKILAVTVLVSITPSAARESFEICSSVHSSFCLPPRSKTFAPLVPHSIFSPGTSSKVLPPDFRFRSPSPTNSLLVGLLPACCST